jgi:hypothetical protein
MTWLPPTLNRLHEHHSRPCARAVREIDLSLLARAARCTGEALGLKRQGESSVSP